MDERITPEASGVWRLRATIRKKAVTSKDNRVFIPSFDTGKTYDSQYIAVGVQVENSKDSWRNGGYLSQEYQFSCNGYDHNNKAFNKLPDLLINDVSILNLPLLSDNSYKLRYFPPTYFSSVRLQIWEYTGVKIDLLLQDLADFFRDAPPDLLINLPTIEAKIDLLLTNQQSGLAVDLSSLESKLDRLLECCNCTPASQPEDEIDYYTFAKFFYLL